MRSLLLTAALAYGDYCFSGPGDVRVRVALDGNRVNVNAISTAQWVGFGVPRAPNYDEMGYGNFYIGGGNSIYERALSTDRNGKPNTEIQHIIPNSARITTTNGVTNISFSRLLAPPGGNVINASQPLFLWASGSIDSSQTGFAAFNYHGRSRGHFLANFTNGGNCPPIASTSLPPTPMVMIGKAKAAKAKNAKAAKAKGKGVVCTAGQTPCTAEIQRMGMNCALNSCVTVPNNMRGGGSMMQTNVMGGSMMQPNMGGNMMGGNGPSMMISPSAPPDVVTIAQFVPYPGTGYNVTGSVIARFVGTRVTLQYDLRNVDPRCTQITSAANSCGIHIHVGRTCSNNTDIAGHFYGSSFSATTDPWLNVSYRADNRGTANGVTSVDYGAMFNSTAGRAVVVHDQNGTRMACALIPQSSNSTAAVNPMASTIVTVSNFTPYPGTTAFNVSGSVVMKFANNSVSMDYRLQNSDVKCVTAIGVANSCGLHIHVGKTCANATEISGHYYDNSTFTTDPWLPIVYVSNNRGVANGATSVAYGYSYAQSAGRAVVVHDQNGTRMACALIPQGGNMAA